MIDTLFLARYLGILFIVFSIATYYRRELLHQVLARLTWRPGVFFLIGVTEFSIGLLLVLLHQSWASFPAVVVSLLSWLFIIEGLTYAVLPRVSIVHAVARANRDDIFIATSIVSLALGIVLALFGFGVL